MVCIMNTEIQATPHAACSHKNRIGACAWYWLRGRETYIVARLICGSQIAHVLHDAAPDVYCIVQQ